MIPDYQGLFPLWKGEVSRMYHRHFDVRFFIAEAQDNNGASRSLVYFEKPTSGYMVSLDESAELIVEKLDPVTLVDWIGEHEAVLLRGDKFIGAWLDNDTNLWHIDIATNVTDIDRAIAFAKLHNQVAIWDVLNRSEIRTNQYTPDPIVK